MFPATLNRPPNWPGRCRASPGVRRRFKTVSPGLRWAFAMTSLGLCWAFAGPSCVYLWYGDLPFLRRPPCTYYTTLSTCALLDEGIDS